MTGQRLWERLHQEIEQSEWLTETNLNFDDVYFEDNPASVPFELLDEDEAFVQIRRKFFYPLTIIGEALTEEVARWETSSQKPTFQIVIDVDYEWETIALLIWNNQVIVRISERASYFRFDSEVDMADFLSEKYQEGIARLQELLLGYVNTSDR